LWPNKTTTLVSKITQKTLNDLLTIIESTKNTIAEIDRKIAQRRKAQKENLGGAYSGGKEWNTQIEKDIQGLLARKKEIIMSILRAEVEINGYLLIREMEDSLREDFQEIKEFGDFLQFSAAFADRITRTVGAKIDEMEAVLKKKAPYLKYIDIKPS